MRPDFQECNELKNDGRINPESTAIRDNKQKNNKQKTNIPAPKKISFGILARRPENFAGSAAGVRDSLKFS
jgi:hypothetical protein